MNLGACLKFAGILLKSLANLTIRHGTQQTPASSELFV